MNPFQALVPPNMDVTCQSLFIGNYSLTTPLQLLNSTTTQVCSDPWSYYKGYGFDIVVVILVVFLVSYVVLSGLKIFNQK